MNKNQVYRLFYDFITSRPGLEFANYGWQTTVKIDRYGRKTTHYSASAYYCDKSRIYRDRVKALATLERAFGPNSPEFDEAVLRDVLKRGRLTLIERDGEVALDYCVGQYYPTEYRRAANERLEYYLNELERKKELSLIGKRVKITKEGSQYCGLYGVIEGEDLNLCPVVYRVRTFIDSFIFLGWRSHFEIIESENRSV